MAPRNIVAPIDFARRMKTHWDVALGNTSSNVLEQLWQITARTFNDAIIAIDQRWRVLEPATGMPSLRRGGACTLGPGEGRLEER